MLWRGNTTVSGTVGACIKSAMHIPLLKNNQSQKSALQFFWQCKAPKFYKVLRGCTMFLPYVYSSSEVKTSTALCTNSENASCIFHMCILVLDSKYLQLCAQTQRMHNVLPHVCSSSADDIYLP
jgi:hypothetical protein